MTARKAKVTTKISTRIEHDKGATPEERRATARAVKAWMAALAELIDHPGYADEIIASTTEIRDRGDALKEFVRSIAAKTAIAGGALSIGIGGTVAVTNDRDLASVAVGPTGISATFDAKDAETHRRESDANIAFTEAQTELARSTTAKTDAETDKLKTVQVPVAKKRPPARSRDRSPPKQAADGGGSSTSIQPPSPTRQ